MVESLVSLSAHSVDHEYNNVSSSSVKKKRKKKKKRRHKHKTPKVQSAVITDQNSANMWDAYDMAYEQSGKGKKKKCRNKREETDQYVKYDYRNEAHDDEDSSLTDEEAGVSYKKHKKKKRAKDKTVIKRSETSKKLDPAYRREAKAQKNLSRTGIGICRFRGRTLFGKSSEDWVGLLVEYGEGAHNGTVKGKTYFRCAAGKVFFNIFYLTKLELTVFYLSKKKGRDGAAAARGGGLGPLGRQRADEAHDQGIQADHLERARRRNLQP